MIRVKAILLAVILVALALVGALLWLDNHTPVRLRFLNLESPELAVFWWLLVAFLGGVGVGFGLFSLGFVRGRLNERRLKRSLLERDRELDRLPVGDAAQHGDLPR